MARSSQGDAVVGGPEERPPAPSESARGDEDEGTRRVDASSGAPTVFSLRATVIEGADQGRSFVLDPAHASRILVGSSPACDLALTDPTVSRRHLSFEPVGQRYRVTDLSSTNGTFVDGVAVIEAFVRGGEVVRCGATALRLDPAHVEVKAPSNAMGWGRLMGASGAMRRLYPLCERLAGARVPALLEGETGTGKEVLALSLHEMGPFAKSPFIVFDCTTVSPSLVEAELFGHERGAFTGAVSSRPGVLEQAAGGTLFIDEIGDLELPLQAKLLRAVEKGEFRRVGATHGQTVDVRILAATRRDLDREIVAGRFRDDLFHRLAVARIELPPLRQRQGDVSLLARHFAEELRAPPGSISPGVLARFEDYAWPGNVRELKNAIARRIVFGDEAEISSQRKGGAEPAPELGLRERVDALVGERVSYAAARRQVLDDFERCFVEAAVKRYGSVTKAADAVGVAARYLRLMRARADGRDGDGST